MTDAPTPPTSVSPPPGPAPPSPRPGRAGTFLGRLGTALREQNWVAVAVEVVIVVLGVVIGFQVTAWGQGRADRAKEQVYLRQLAADLAETERQARATGAWMAAGPQAVGSRLLQTWGTPQPTDSVLAWVRDASDWRFDLPVVGTAEALVATGDLSLLRDDSLRSALTAYLDIARTASVDYARTNEQMVRYGEALAERFDYVQANEGLEGEAARLRGRFVRGLMPDSAWTSPFPLDVATLHRDPVAYGLVVNLAYGHDWLSQLREGQRESAASLRQRVEAQIAP
ncbi:hypothetical protein [Rubrivirga sp. IMCC43871]|uniref:hypothetical protein n=1 Tax=Rubrivirga sp. IMCC43871 TaxID=3391575 RepID=UPI00398FB8A9